jgi:hypothetical protein
MKFTAGEKRVDPTSACRFGTALVECVRGPRPRWQHWGVFPALCTGSLPEIDQGGVECVASWCALVPDLEASTARRAAKSIKESSTLKAVDHLFRTRPICRNDFTLSALSPPNLDTLSRPFVLLKQPRARRLGT